MAGTYSGRVIGEILREEGIERVFSIHGAGTYAFLNGMAEQGIKMYHMRHEQSAGYAADGSARTSRKVGVCTVMGGVGMENIIPAIAHCQQVRSPMLVFAGQHASTQDGMRTWIEAYGADMCRPVAKWTHRIVEPHTIAYNVRKALHVATSYPPGPVLLEIPWNVSLTTVSQQLWHIDAMRKPRCTPSQGSPKAIEELVEMLFKAERPLFICGDGVFWCDASAEVRELSRLANVPVHGRRMGRGVVPEDDARSINGEQRGRLLERADLIVLVGHEASFLDDWFSPPSWNHGCKYVQVHENPELVFLGLPTDLTIIGTPKSVLRQCLEVMKKGNAPVPARGEWLEFIRETKEKHLRRLASQEAKERRSKGTIHPDLIAAELTKVLDKDATIILDSMTLSSLATQRISTTFAGQVLDTGLQIGIGHSVGMAIGAQLERPGKQVVSLIGDGGIGIAGMDIETAARYGLKPVFVILNNSSWGTKTARPLLFPKLDSWGITPGIRYDRVFAEMGCHGEHVDKVSQIRPALERALASGKTAVVNIVADVEAPMPLTTRSGLMECWARNDFDECSEETKRLYRSLDDRELERSAGWLKDRGFEVEGHELKKYFHSQP